MKHLVLALRCLLLALLASSAAAQSTPFAVRVLNSSGVESVQTGSSTGSAFTSAATLPSAPGMWQYAFTGGSGSGAAGAPFLTLSAATATLTTAATVTTTLLGQSSSTSASATLGGGGPLVHACWSGGGLMGLRATPGGAVVLGMISPSGPIGITEATGFAAASACPNAWVSAVSVALDPLGGVMYFVCGQAGTAQVVALNTATGAVINTTSISGIGGVITGLALTQTTGALNALALRADAGSARGGRSRRRSPGGRVAALALALACAAASLQVAAAKPLASMAIMKLNQIDPTVRRVARRRNCAQRCCAALWGLRGPSPAAARCASLCVPIRTPRRLPAACG